MVFHYVSEGEVLKQVKLLKKEGDIMNISRRFLLLCLNHVCKPTTALFDLCINEGVVPENYKTAKITLVYKKGVLI